MDELAVTTDTAEQGVLLGEIEAQVIDDGFGLPIYQHPAIDVFRNTVTGLAPIQLSPTVFWNYWEWGVSGDTAGEPTSEEMTTEEEEG